MKKHDETIQNLFDDYAKDLTPRVDLAEKARMEMVERKAQPSASSRRSSFGVHLAWIAPVAVLFIAVIVIIFNLPIFSMPNDNSQGDGPTQQQPAVAYYTFADVKGKSVSLNEYDDMLQVSRLETLGYQVVGQRCYAFYSQDEQLRYVKVYLGLRSTDGTFTEMEIIAEVDGYVRSDLKDIFNKYSANDDLSVESYYDDDGEYVTQAYFAARNWHFYVLARNGQQTEAAQDIVEHLADEANK